MLDDNKGIVIYVDASARPNPGKVGLGMHGYLYEIKQLNKNKTVDNYIITNKGYVNKLEDGAMPVEPINYFDMVVSSLEEGSNNKGEILALYESLIHIESNNVKFIHVLTDSEYVRNGLTEWCKSWDKTNWIKQDGGYVSNYTQWKKLYYKVQELKSIGVEFTIEWIKGHDDNLGNVQADVMSVIGMNYSTDKILLNSFNTSPVSGYWKADIERHPFINFKRIYHNTIKEYNINGKYFQAEPGEDDSTGGKRVPEAGYSVINLKTPDTAIEIIKNRQYELANGINAISMIKLDRLYHKTIYPYVINYGKYGLMGSKNNLNVNFIDNKPISVEQNPTGLSLRAIEAFNLLDDILTSFIHNKEPDAVKTNNDIKIKHYDVTDSFFNVVERKVKKDIVFKSELKSEFIPGFKHMNISIDYDNDGSNIKLNIPIILGLDTLPRNNLKKLEDECPKIFLIMWKESSKTIRYATIIDSVSGIGIWSNYFADKIFLNI